MSSIDDLVKQAKEAQQKMSPEERTLMSLRQKRSWVVSELMWGTDADEAACRDAMTREEAERRYDMTEAGIALKMLEASIRKD